LLSVVGAPPAAICARTAADSSGEYAIVTLRADAFAVTGDEGGAVRPVVGGAEAGRLTLPWAVPALVEGVPTGLLAGVLAAGVVTALLAALCAPTS
jgi:hypothetical protein